jgi:DNA-binding XRE family transcriptional regulator
MMVRDTMSAESRGKLLMNGYQCRAARAWLGWRQEELAQMAGVGLSTLKDFEKSDRKTIPAIVNQIQRVFEEVGVEFTRDEGGQRIGISIKVDISSLVTRSLRRKDLGRSNKADQASC